MGTTPGKYIPAAELRRMSAGSLEERIRRSKEAVSRFMEVGDYTVLAVYEDRVVVFHDEMVSLLRLEWSDSGVTVTKRERINAEIYSDSTASEFVYREVSEAVSLFMSGSKEAAADRIGRLEPIVSKGLLVDREAVIEDVVAHLATDRWWSRVVQERRSAIANLVGDDINSIEERRLEPKFMMLYDESADPSVLEGNRERVTGGLNAVIGRLQAVVGEVSGAVESLKSENTDSDDSVLGTYRKFAVDLLDDVGQFVAKAEVAAGSMVGVDKRGKLYDLLASGLYEREVAGRFVTAVAQQLASAS